jgi:hypothetical protein
MKSMKAGTSNSARRAFSLTSLVIPALTSDIRRSQATASPESTLSALRAS